MDPYEIKHMIIDDQFDGEEFVTADFTHNHRDYSITFKKADLEIINAWLFVEHTSIPANLSSTLIESIRQDIKNQI
ncbi:MULTISPECIES: hypothetical protein [Metabacillus]|uniref:Uncharacterized protein n=1 Tax=Metabacillus rhizolycopersici TaxID=2875709 RepID=A0ABS7UL55_9BACI|nr:MULTISPECIES: hypothetical protein [Metabacillus]MBZ5748886.1 hypothetical protein [Metabacillus rhizolycopersici]MCM3651002.1 hypothetical protein [Metabacillus litoralis]